eukprot:scaffold2798_cov160-Ochromonas_danica.AAC.19
MSWSEAFEKAKEIARLGEEEEARAEASLAETKESSTSKLIMGQDGESESEVGEGEEDKEGGFCQPKKLAKFMAVDSHAEVLSAPANSANRKKRKNSRRPLPDNSSKRTTGVQRRSA